MSVRRLVCAIVVSVGVLACWLGGGVGSANATVGHKYESQLTGVSLAEPFGLPWGLSFDASGNLFVADAQQQAVDVFDLSDVFVPPQVKSSAFSQPYTRGVAVSTSGVLYVAESGPEEVDVLAPEGGGGYKLLQQTRFGNYVYVAVDNHPVGPSDPRAGDVYVRNGESLHAVKVDSEGKLEGEGVEVPAPAGGFTLGSRGGGRGGEAGLAVDAATGNVYVANPASGSGSGVVYVFNDLGVEQSSLELKGTETPQGTAFSPVAVAIDDASEVVYVVDAQAGVVDEFSMAGVYLGQITGQGSPAGRLVEPLGVAVQEHAGPMKGFVYVSDGGAKAVDVFGLPVVLADVATGSATGVTAASATLNGSVNPDGVGVSDCRFEYRGSEEAVFVHSAPCVPAPGGGSSVVAVSADIGGLLPVMTYRYRLAVTNANGVNDGSEQEFTTPLAVEGVSTGPAEEVKVSSAKLTGSLSPNGTDAHYYFEYGATGAYGSSVPVPPGTDAGVGGAGCVPPGGGSCVAVAAGIVLEGLEAGTTYHYRLVAVNSFGTTRGGDETFKTGGPGFHDESISDVTDTSATLNSAIEPNGSSATYYFQYSTSSTSGCQVSSSSCATVPVPPGETVGAGTQEVQAVQHVQGLTASTVYHYRVVVSELVAGEPVTIFGEDRSFTTQVAGGGFALLDGRAWEMVSPPDKYGAGLLADGYSTGAAIQAAVGGGAIAYAANAPIVADPEGNRALEPSEVLSRRGVNGWGAQDIATPHNRVAELTVGNFNEYFLFSEDLSSGFVVPAGNTPLSSLAPGSERTPYIRNDTSGEYEPLLPASNMLPGIKYDRGRGVSFQGASPDLRHIVLSSGAPLLPGATEEGLYEWSAGRLELVSELPVGEERELIVPWLGYPFGGNTRNAISNDGSRVIWTEGFKSGSYEPALYLRDMGRKETIRLTASQGGSDGAAGEGESKPVYEYANSVGSRVFFTDTHRLTVDSQAGYHAPDLYVFEVTSGPSEPLAGKLTDLTYEDKFKETETKVPAVGVVSASSDGAYVYFVTGGVIGDGTGRGAVQGTCEGSNPQSRCNLYVDHLEGGKWGAPRFIASLSLSDSRGDWGSRGDLHGLTAKASPDGQYLAFMSDRRLTGYDNRDVNSGESDEEVFLYHFGAPGKVVCVSCDPTGARPVGLYDPEVFPGLLVDGAETWGHRWLAANIPTWNNTNGGAAPYQSRYLSDGGRLFFNSVDSLVPAHVDGRENVYEFEPKGTGGCDGVSHGAGVVYSPANGGCVGLISSGSSSEESAFLDASEGGGEVFFLTSSRLVPQQDYDSAIDLYVARECTGSSPCVEPSTTPPVCVTAEGCRAAASVQPAIFGAPSSATFSGAGNIIGSPVAGRVKSRSLTRAQKLAKALSACRRARHVKRKPCESRARRKYRIAGGNAFRGVSVKSVSVRKGR